MEFVIDSLGDELSQRFTTYKQRSIVEQVLELILMQFSTIQINCAKCNEQVIIKDYIDHLLKCQVFELLIIVK